MKSNSRPPVVSALMNQRGITLPLVAIMLFVFLGITALAIDLAHLYVVRNELQNAADAGALAGARFLYDGFGVNAGANEIACQAARDNMAISVAGVIPVDVDWGDGFCNGADNAGDVQRGHWSFATHTFTPNNSLDSVDLWEKTTAELDRDLNFINAVRVVARRQANPAASFFARIFGYENFELSAEAIAYIGFAGSLQPEEVDQPIAICKQSIVNTSGQYTCGVGRMVTDSNEPETAAWTDFEQPDNCTGGTNANAVEPLVCGSGNPVPLVFGRDIQVINGQVQSAFAPFWDCWWEKSEGGTVPWEMTLPVIDCNAGGKVDPCEKLIGAVTVNIIWVNDKANTNPKFLDDAPSDNENARPGGAPLAMAGFGEGTGTYGSWSADPSTPGVDRWASFVDHFNLALDSENAIDDWNQKTIYFVPSCKYHEPAGNTGGENFGILAKIPVLVK